LRENSKEALLFWKKEAKNFFKLGRAGENAGGPKSKSFCAAFFKKLPLTFLAQPT
jgi:hypothetical protein